jgi:outer membrane biosynthesis protein TonB
MPWLVSLGVHVVLVLTVGILLASPLREPLAPQVDITLVGAPGPGRGAPAGGGGPSARAVVPRPERPETPQPEPPPRPVRRSTPVEPAPAPPRSLPMPSARDVLPDAAAASQAAQPVSGDAAASSADAPGSPFGTDVAWEGLARKLIRRRVPEFPTILSAIGQEVEMEARIWVAPSGIVTRVEITRGSGYIEVDASVEAALHDYVFSPVGGRTETVGTERFRFRLEKQD